MPTRSSPRRLAGTALVVAGALLLAGVLAWRLVPGIGAPPAPAVGARFSTTPTGGPVEAAAPLRVDVTVDLQDSGSSGPEIAPSVDLQLRDSQQGPAVYGPGPAAPLAMHVGGTLTDWTSELSAPTRPGQYHVHLFVRNAGRPDFEIDLPQPVLIVVPAAGYPGGLVYSRNGNLWRTDSAGRHTQRLTFYTDDGRAQDPAWSRDGAQIAFARTLPAAASDIPRLEIWTLNPSGAAATQLVVRHPDEDLLAPTFAADGSLLFTSDRVVMPKTGATPTIDQLTDALESWSIDRLAPAVPSGTRQPLVPDALQADVSRDGRLMVYLGAAPHGAESESVPTRTLMLATGDGRPIRQLVPADMFQNLLYPRLSPDGTQVAFAAVDATGVPGGLNLFEWLGLAPRPAAANGIPWDIYLVPVAGGAPTRLTQLNADQPFPAWSRDGTHLALLTERGLYVLDIAHPATLPGPIGPGSSHGQLAWYEP